MFTYSSVCLILYDHSADEYRYLYVYKSIILGFSLVSLHFNLHARSRYYHLTSHVRVENRKNRTLMGGECRTTFLQAYNM